MTTLRIEVPRVMRPLLQPMRFKALFGGRRSAQSHFFAGYLVSRAVAEPGLRVVCIRGVQRSLAQYQGRISDASKWRPLKSSLDRRFSFSTRAFRIMERLRAGGDNVGRCG